MPITTWFAETFSTPHRQMQCGCCLHTWRATRPDLERYTVSGQLLRCPACGASAGSPAAEEEP